ncbi:MAG: YdcF family protein [Hahellaceae bacterium]|jgi:uncharacterized SAM-binding protein YcdF (DUF218 family)|nr:YdcF family protein [Hahellaceae bacterium]
MGDFVMMDALFFVKKLAGSMLTPLPLFFLLIIFALLLLVFKKPRASSICAGIAIVWVFLAAFPPFGKWLIKPLEDRYPAYAGQSVDVVVVLGGWHETDTRAPVTSVLSSYSTFRLLEGVRLATINPQATLYLSGYPGFTDRISNAQAMKNLALVLGIAADRIHTVAEPLDTYEESLYIREYVGDRPFALVTSAYHMPRAMALMRSRGLSPVAAPTDFLGKDNGQRSFFSYWPSTGAMNVTSAAMHEWIGYWWSQLNGQIVE